MSDVIFIVATIVFFAICALYVHWCDTIIGPDDFRLPSEVDSASLDAGADDGGADSARSYSEVTS